MRKIKTISADCLTAISIYLRLKGKKKSLLESIPRDKNQARYSIVGVDPVHEISAFGYQLRIDNLVEEVTDPLKAIERFLSRESEPTSLPFEAGAIGYVGYDVCALYEEVGTVPEDQLGIPDCHFYVYESFVIFDHLKEQVTLVQDNLYSQRSEVALEQGIEKMVAELKLPHSEEQGNLKLDPLTFTSNLSQKQYEGLVLKSKELIQAGDLFQVVPSQRLSAPFLTDSFDYYRGLRLSNPSAYLYYLDFGETKIIGSSPESLVSVQGEKVLTNPIAGTRKRGQTIQEDQALADELLHDEKELAEHKMLVDLSRNDISRIAEVGSVTVPVYLVVEKYRYVMHLVSVVEGRLRSDVSAMDALKATLPAGTVSGAPKIRAMQRIYELEPVKRNVYGGAVGYLTHSGKADFAIAIRTMVLHQGVAHVQAGAGVVHDSNPTKEYEETLHKAKALLEVHNYDFTC